MGRPPSNGVPSFRFNSVEVAEMDAILQAHNFAMPGREVLDALAEKFSLSADRSGKFVVQAKQVWHWFQNRRYALRAKASRAPETLNISSVTQDESSVVKHMPQASQSKSFPQDTATDKHEVPQSLVAPGSRNVEDSSLMEFEAKSARDGAWYDVAMFLSHRSSEAVDPEVLVRFAGFGAEEDEWINVSKLVRKRSLPCESSECVAVLQGDLILCFQEGKEQALYFDAHVLDAQRRRHDARGCRCRFLVRYDHDQSEEIVPLRKVCRRPETDYRLQQLHASNESVTMKQPKAGAVPHTDNTLRVYPPAEPPQKPPKIKDSSDVVPVLPGASQPDMLAGTENKTQEKTVDIIDVGTSRDLSAPHSKLEGSEIEDSSDVPVLPGASQTNLLSRNENNTQETIVADNIDAGTPTISSVPQSKKLEDSSDVLPGWPNDSEINTLAGTENKIEETKDADIIDTGTLTDSCAPQSDKMEDSSDVVPVLPGASQTNILAETKDKAQETIGTDIIYASTPQDNTSLEPQTNAVSPSSMDISDAGIVVQQPKGTVIINSGVLESLKVAPAMDIQQQEVTEIVSAADLENTLTPPVNVISPSDGRYNVKQPKPNATTTINSSECDAPGNSMLLPSTGVDHWANDADE